MFELVSVMSITGVDENTDTEVGKCQTGMVFGKESRGIAVGVSSGKFWMEFDMEDYTGQEAL